MKLKKCVKVLSVEWDLKTYNDIQVGDVMECFEVKEVARSLESIDKKVG